MPVPRSGDSGGCGGAPVGLTDTGKTPRQCQREQESGGGDQGREQEGWIGQESHESQGGGWRGLGLDGYILTVGSPFHCPKFERFFFSRNHSHNMTFPIKLNMQHNTTTNLFPRIHSVSSIKKGVTLLTFT